MLPASKLSQLCDPEYSCLFFVWKEGLLPPSSAACILCWISYVFDSVSTQNPEP
jgi:hypothetical protein